MKVDDIENDEYIGVIHTLDSQVRIENALVKDHQRVVVNRNGFLRLQTMHKISIKGVNNQPNFIMTICDDVINHLSAYQLFNLYLGKYSQKSLAIHYFLKHIKIDRYFNFYSIRNFPTQKQLVILLKLSELGDYKSVAKSLQLTYKAIEFHIANVKNKICFGNIDEILLHLRRRAWLSAEKTADLSYLAI